MADELGAVRRTPRPYPSTGDRQTPETGPSAGAGATNGASPVPSRQDGVSSRVSSQHDDGRHWTLGDGELGPETTKIAEALEELRGKIHATAVLGHLHTTDDDMQAFLELPDCQACEGTGKDQHASPFEAPLAVHFAGPPVRAEGRRRQLCMWCGHVLADLPSRKGETLPEPWLSGVLVRIEDGLGTVVPHEPGAELPPGCCALPDDEPAAMAAAAGVPWCDEHGHPADRCSYCAADDGAIDESTAQPDPAADRVRRGLEDIADALGTTAADVHKGLRAYVDGALADDGPDEAQETRAAADWPAEPVDTRYDEQEPNHA